MINILKKRWQRVAWFIASFLTVMLFSFTSNQFLTTTAAASPKMLVKSSLSSAAFKQVAASHLEPNFYQ